MEDPGRTPKARQARAEPALHVEELDLRRSRPHGRGCRPSSVTSLKQQVNAEQREDGSKEEDQIRSLGDHQKRAAEEEGDLRPPRRIRPRKRPYGRGRTGDGLGRPYHRKREGSTGPVVTRGPKGVPRASQGAGPN